MTERKDTTSSALISTDPAFRNALRKALAGSGRPITIGCEITEPLAQMAPASVSELKRLDPELVFLDLGDDPAVGVQFAQFLADSNPRRQFVAVGPVLQPELLMEAMRAGVSEYLPKPVSADVLSAALERTARKMGLAADGGATTTGKLLATFSVKGGSGTTTVATNLAIQLHKLTRKKTLLVDLNLEMGDVALFLGMQPRFTFMELIRNLHRMDAELLASFTDSHESGVHLISGPEDPGTSEALSPDTVHKILGFLRQHYDYIVVDTSKSFGAVTMAILEQADEVLLVTNADLPSVRNIKRTMPLLVHAAGGTDEHLRLVLNRYQEDDMISLKQVEGTLGMAVYATLANDQDTATRAINSGKPFILDGKSTLSSDLGSLGARLVGMDAAKDARKGPLGSIKKLLGFNKEKGIAHE